MLIKKHINIVLKSWHKLFQNKWIKIVCIIWMVKTHLIQILLQLFTLFTMLFHHWFAHYNLLLSTLIAVGSLTFHLPPMVCKFIHRPLFRISIELQDFNEVTLDWLSGTEEHSSNMWTLSYICYFISWNFMVARTRRSDISSVSISDKSIRDNFMLFLSISC